MSKPGSAFGFGFTAGILVGAVGVFLLATEEGKKVRSAWEKEWAATKKESPSNSGFDIPVAALWKTAKEKLEVLHSSLVSGEESKKARLSGANRQSSSRGQTKKKRFKGT